MKLILQVLTTIMVGIALCLSIASVVMIMGAVYLNVCHHNQMATFLLVNGGITLSIAIVLIILYCYFANISPYILMVKLGLSIFGSVAIFGKFET